MLRRQKAIVTMAAGLFVCVSVPLWAGDDAAAATSGDSSAARPDLMQPIAVRKVGAEYQLALEGRPPLRVTDKAIHNARMLRVPDSVTIVALWEEGEPGSTQPFYAISRDGERFSFARATSYDVKLQAGEFDPGESVRAVAGPLSAGPDNDLYIVQFIVQPLKVFRDRVTELGGTVYSYLANHARIVRMSPETKAAVEALPYVRWVGPYHPAYRLEPFLAAALSGSGAALETQGYGIQVFETGPVQKQAVADRIEAMGGTVDVLTAEGAFFLATLTPEQLSAVAAMPEVLYVDRSGPPQASMNNARAIGGADYIESQAGYTGAGVRAEVMDNGCQPDHPAYASRITFRRPAPEEAHGTSTFGINFGDGTGSALGRGMLPDGDGIFSLWGTTGFRVSDTGQLVNSTWRCVFQSNSWGTIPVTTAYNTAAAELDEAVFRHDIVIVQSQGNEGTQESDREAWAKNVVSVGGINHLDTFTRSDDYWGGASIGPAADGRIKPDLCQFYDWVRTTTSGGGYTSTFGGTSASCPIVAGHFGLFFQMWADGVLGNPVSGGSVFEERPHSSTARAVVINHAKPYSFAGETHNLTRMHQGWGLPDLQSIYSRRENSFVVDETDVLQEGETTVYKRYIKTGEPNHDRLRVTLVYTDYWGTTSSSQHRINDVSLRLTSPSGEAYYGNHGLLTGNTSTTGGTWDSINTVENFWMNFPEEGTWTIEVWAAEVNEDGHEETPEDDVDYALAINGGWEMLDCNGNGIPDRIDLEEGTSGDANGNDIPDECEAERLYVDDTATGSDHGTSWEDAFQDLQAALQVAKEPENPLTEVWVAAGVYRPDGQTGERDRSFTIYGDLGVYGGFTGGETERDQRNPATSRVILSGDIGVPADSSDNSYHVVEASEALPGAVLDGFTVAGGHAEGNDPTDRGGGLYINGGSLFVRDCWFVGNQAATGGGMLIQDASLEMLNCLFSGNESLVWAGGAIQSLGSETTIRSSTFSQNTSATMSGGAIRSAQSDALNIRNSILYGNSANGMQDEAAQIGQDGTSSADIQFACVQGWTGSFGGIGNIDGDPLFADPAGPDGVPGTLDDNLRLVRGSACIDAGNTADVIADVATDLDRMARLVDDVATPDTGGGGYPVVDMGAYEFFLGGDMDGDNDIDLADARLFDICLGLPAIGFCAPGDMNQDSTVSEADLPVFVLAITGPIVP